MAGRVHHREQTEYWIIRKKHHKRLLKAAYPQKGGRFQEPNIGGMLKAFRDLANEFNPIYGKWGRKTQ